MTDGPKCLVCGATSGVEFTVFSVQTTGFTFGQICVPHDVGDGIENCECVANQGQEEACHTHMVQYRLLHTGKTP